MSLTLAQKRRLHACTCGHLNAAHDAKGCRGDRGSCPCRSDGLAQVQTNYAAIEAVVDDAIDALRAELDRLRSGVKALADEWSGHGCKSHTTAARWRVQALRALLTPDPETAADPKASERGHG